MHRLQMDKDNVETKTTKHSWYQRMKEMILRFYSFYSLQSYQQIHSLQSFLALERNCYFQDTNIFHCYQCLFPFSMISLESWEMQQWLILLLHKIQHAKKTWNYWYVLSIWCSGFTAQHDLLYAGDAKLGLDNQIAEQTSSVCQ